MKKCITVIMLLVFFFIGAPTIYAIDWTVANQATVAWDAVTKTAEGENFSPGDAITYQVYIVESGAEKDTAVKVGNETEDLQKTVTFTEEGRWLAGVQTVRNPAASPDDTQKSSITWSDSTDQSAVPVQFGFMYFASPAEVTGFGPKPQ